MEFNELLDYTLLRLSKYSLTVGMVAGAFVIWLSTWFALRVLSRILLRPSVRDNADLGRRHSLLLLVRYVAWVIAILLIMQAIGIHLSVLLAGSAALLVGLGLGVQDIFRDIVSGIILLYEGTIEVGDVLEIEGKVGRVEDIKLRTSKICTREGIFIIMPNYKFISENVINWSHYKERPARFSVSVGVSFDADEEQVRQALIECAVAHPDVIKKPAKLMPFARIIDFAESRIVFELFFWVNRKFQVENTCSDIRYAILKKFREQGIIIPFPQRDVRMK
ncbi:MAG: mechanosensitive ion channel family protein [Saprospiraceae bacterium]